MVGLYKFYSVWQNKAQDLLVLENKNEIINIPKHSFFLKEKLERIIKMWHILLVIHNNQGLEIFKKWGVVIVAGGYRDEEG